MSARDTTATAERVEARLRGDLHELRERFGDEKFMTELYRALANREWARADGDPPGHVALSWRRAEELVNELREAAGAPPLELAQTGGEGDLSETVGSELTRLGWRSRPLDTSRHDDAHVSEPEREPPGDEGERHAPDDPEVRYGTHASGDVQRRSGP